MARALEFELAERSFKHSNSIATLCEIGFILNESLLDPEDFLHSGSSSKEIDGITFCPIELYPKFICAGIVLNFLGPSIAGSVKQALEVSLRLFGGPDFPRFHQATPRTH